MAILYPSRFPEAKSVKIGVVKIALVYDRVNKIGGAERILRVLHEIWPEAPLYTSVYNPQTAPWAKVFPKVIPSFVKNFPFAMRHELYAALMPLAFESFNFDDYDVVISVTTEAAKGIITKPKTLHICYCLTPTRYLWSHYDLYFKNEFFRWLTKPVVAYLRMWDKIASQRPDYYLAISENVRGRIKKYYGRDSEVVYPPMGIQQVRNTQNTQNIRKSEHQKIRASDQSDSLTIRPTEFSEFSGNYFLIVSRLVPYKRIDIAIEAFNELGLPLKIVGRGSEMGKLKSMAKPNIEFLQELTDDALLRYYQGCQALIFPQDEDLGLTAIEAQACGKPVIAYKGGGAIETVVPGRTGEFFYPQTAEALKNTVSHFASSKYKARDCQQNAQRFSKEIFNEKFEAAVGNLWRKHLKTATS